MIRMVKSTVTRGLNNTYPMSSGNLENTSSTVIGNFVSSKYPVSLMPALANPMSTATSPRTNAPNAGVNVVYNENLIYRNCLTGNTYKIANDTFNVIAYHSIT